MGFEEDTKGAIGSRGEVDLQVKFKSERIRIDEGPHKFQKTNVGDAFILGHPVNGILGVANGVGGGQITLGVTDIGATTLLQVINERNVFKEYFRYTDYVDTTNTTATVDTTLHEIQF